MSMSTGVDTCVCVYTSTCTLCVTVCVYSVDVVKETPIPQSTDHSEC